MADELNRAEWIAAQIRKKLSHPAVVMGGLKETLEALADFVIDTERRVQALEQGGGG